MADCEDVVNSNTALEAYTMCGASLATQVAKHARKTALDVLNGAPVVVETIVIDRSGNVIARADFK